MEIGIDDQAICIANDYNLAAVVSSYFNRQGKYLTVFNFNVIEDSDNIYSDIARNRYDVLTGNAIRTIRPEIVILCGLDKYQLSFFNYVPSKRKIIINSLEEIDKKLGYLQHRFIGVLECRQKELCEGLYTAKQTNKKLVINESASETSAGPRGKRHAIIAEKSGGIEDVVVSNYAAAINADLYFIGGFSQQEQDKVEKLLQEWGETRKISIFNQIEKKCRVRLGKIKLEQYESVTFFTECFPYGFILKNVVPISHAIHGHITQYFIFNSILSHEYDVHNLSALVFSPQLLSKEEHDFVAKEFSANNYFVKQLLGKDALVETYRQYVQIFPYDFLHIATHGGTTEGYYISRDFIDRNDQKHSIQFIEVVTFALTAKVNDKGEPLIAVSIKSIPRYLDGLKWKSPELHAKSYPKYVYEDAFNAIRLDSTKNEKRIPTKFFVPDAVYIQCYDGMDQGMYHQLASGGSPIIFNNSCYSWSIISHGFLGNGARGYIGTIWKIGDETAVSSAEVFYSNLFEGTVLNAFYKMVTGISAKQYKDIYIYWGLPFTRMARPNKLDPTNLMENIFQHALGTARLMASPTKDIEVKRNARDNLDFIKKLLKEDLADFERRALEEEISSIETEYISIPEQPEEAVRYNLELTKEEANRLRTSKNL